MFTVRKAIPVLCLAASLSGLAVYAATTSPPAADAPSGAHWRHGHHGFWGVLHKLGLTDAQKTQVKSIMAGYKTQFEALRTSAKTNREALATTAPTDPGYPALVQTAETNAATRIKLETEIWSAIYTGVLTHAQQGAIPGIVAAAQAQRAARVAAWKADHAAPATSAD
jgi:hypothetical protein